MKILVTGGPVHARIDSVKFVTNGFKGGLMASLALQLAKRGHTVTYLSSIPQSDSLKDAVEEPGSLLFALHDGIGDYQEKVLKMAPEMDAVVLGAAVANLMPVCFYNKPEMIGAFNSAPTVGSAVQLPLKGKFPSHNYKPGDRIVMEWTIAPRIIDMVRAVAPKTTLVGFKLLDGVPYEELVSAAWGVLVEAKADVVFANDKGKLETVYAVTKERAVNRLNRRDITDWVCDLASDVHYKTVDSGKPCAPSHARETADIMLRRHADGFTKCGDWLFGTVAYRGLDGSFVCGARGKQEATDLCEVASVNHERHEVVTNGGRKASLNAPLLDYVFRNMPKVYGIVHLHKEDESLPLTLPYAPPGTVRDSIREQLLVGVPQSFNIAGHGVFYLYGLRWERL